MKLKYFASAIMAMALAGCSNNDDVVIENQEQEVIDGQAFLKVKIGEVGANSRGTSDGYQDNPGKNEYSVNSADFYFYDENGYYVAQAYAWNGGNEVKDETDEPYLDLKSNAIIVLDNLTATGYPKYMVTILNKPDTFDPRNKTLTEVEQLLISEKTNEIQNTVWNNNEGTKTDFIMTTSSYIDTGREISKKNYFVTEIPEGSFKDKVDDAINDDNIVNVYVERLAAKVKLNVDAKMYDDDKEIYQLEEVTVAGGANEGDGNKGVIEADEPLYMKIVGWTLTNTANQSYLMKNFDDTWTDNDNEWTFGNNWTGINDLNIEDGFRNYWAKSYFYDYTTVTYNGSTLKEGDNAGIITRRPYEEATSKVGELEYCAENTMDAGNDDDENKLLADKKAVNQNATSILLAAQLVDENGITVDGYVRYRGMLWTYERFYEYMMSAANIYVKTTSEEGTSYAHVEYKKGDADKFKAFADNDNNDNNGVTIQLETTDIANLAIKVNEDYKENPELKDFNDALNSLVKDNKAIAYKNGMMVYSIPIEHLNNAQIGDDGVVPVGKYGVVRNHYYKVTINSIQGVGSGIFDEKDPFIPEEDPTYYYVGAQVNILSWHIVNQSVDL